MVSVPGISIRELLERAPETALRDFVGEATLGVVAIMSPELLTKDNLVALALHLAEPWQMLRDPVSRDRLIAMLPLAKATELAEKLGLRAAGNRVFDRLSAIVRQKGVGDHLLEFFGVVVPERAPGGEESAERTVDPAYPLFAHQLSVADRARDALLEHPHKALVHMPTGAGKTRTAMHLVCEWHNRAGDRLVVWLAQSSELLEQAASEFERAWSSRGRSAATVYRYWGDYEPDLSHARSGFLVAGFAKLYALYRRDPNMILRLGDRATLTVVDEAHQAIAPTYRALISFISEKRPANALLGLTATPGRTWSDIAKDAELASFFDNRKITIEVGGYDNAVDFLIDRGFLARPTFRVLEIAADEHKGKQAYAEESDEIARLGENHRRNVQVLNTIEDLAKRHRRIIVFAASVAHAHLLSSILTLRGTESHVVTASTDRASRERILRRFKGNGVEPQVVCNYGVLTTGFDAPNTSAAVIARPTKSLVLYSQMVGRAIRGPAAGGNATAEIVTVVDTDLPGFGSVADAFVNWEDVWGNGGRGEATS
ncbi:DEAD/DEAH box helicase [Bradyrhizobium sp. 2TAF24]|uniref:DEAD/DEAH box helicase n=1 Tax=Bradyrhizobium sp. 2TAF24 TaxID=3233011 RepID=UPI003F906476